MVQELCLTFQSAPNLSSQNGDVYVGRVVTGHLWHSRIGYCPPDCSDTRPPWGGLYATSESANDNQHLQTESGHHTAGNDVAGNILHWGFAWPLVLVKTPFLVLQLVKPWQWRRLSARVWLYRLSWTVPWYPRSIFPALVSLFHNALLRIIEEC